MNINGQNGDKKIFGNDLIFESNITKIAVALLFGLILEDVFVRNFFKVQKSGLIVLLVQGTLYVLYIIVSLFNLNFVKKEETSLKNNRIIL